MILVPDLTTILKIAKSDAEKRVARILLNIDADDDAVAFYSVKLRSHPRKEQAEADFVILWKGVVIVIEVKGGGVQRLDGIWWTKNRRQEWSKLTESPMEQADGAKYSLRDILKEDGLGWYADQHAVIIPDIDELNNSLGWYESHWATSKQMTIAGIEEMLDSVKDRAQSPPHGVRRATQSQIRTRLYGEFAKLPAIDAQRGAVIEEQNRATAGQAKYLEGLSRNPRLLVLGGAGTGKSLALAEGARQESDQGRSVLITFKSPGLVEYFSALVGDHRVTVRPFGELPANSKYDSCFVDEAQDLMTSMDMDILERHIKGGLTNGSWRMFLDPNNQAQVDGRFDQDTYDLMREDATVFRLPMNVRNTKPIVHVVQSYLGADIGDPGIVNGESLNWHKAADRADVESAELLISDLVKDGLNPRNTWIIDVSSDSPPYYTKSGAIVTSPKHAKGLESERVIVCNIPEVFDTQAIASFYVAVTRARVGLHIILSKDDRKRLQELARTYLENR